MAVILKVKKVTEEIAKIRKLQPYETVDSPNRFDFINNAYDLLKWIDELREMSQNQWALKWYSVEKTTLNN